MKEFTLVYPYYENPTMLRMHLREWRNYLQSYKPRVRVIIVDDGSKDDPALPVIKSNYDLGLQLRLYRVEKDIPWGQDGARNIAMKECETDWALMTDMDHVLTGDQVSAVLAMRAVEGCYYMPYRKQNGQLRNPHPNTYLMRVSDFWSMGGYDEDFCGWYGSDGNFRKCARGAGLAEVTTAGFTMQQYTHEEIADSHTRRYGRKDSQYYAATNPALNAKRTGPPYRAIKPLREPYERLL